MRLLHLSSVARRSGLDLLLVGFVAGIVLTITGLSVMRDGSTGRPAAESHRPVVADDLHVPLAHHHDHHHHHRHDVGDDVKVVDLAEQNRHKHTGE